MSDQLLKLFNKELSYIRHQASSFAKAYPKLAGHLNMTPDKVENPDISRLIEAVALMNSKTREVLEDQFPLVAESLLNTLAPQFNSPIPPMAIIQFNPSPSVTTVLQLKKGSEIESRPVNGSPCRFQLGFDTPIIPFTISQALFSPHNQHTPMIGNYTQANSTLSLTIQATSHNIKLETLPLTRLRIHLKGQVSLVYRLYETLLTDTVQIAISNKRQTQVEPLTLSHLQAAGLDHETLLLPHDKRTPAAHTLLTELLTFPEKFLFLDITLPESISDKIFNQASSSNEFCLHFYFQKAHSELEQYLSKENFALNCAPMINLFSHRLTPITITHQTPDYPLTPDHDNPTHKEIHQLTQVEITNSQGESKEALPLYAQKFQHLANDNTRFYQTHRQQGEPIDGEIDHGSNVSIALVDTQLDLANKETHVLSATALCTNRDLVNQLPFGGSEPRLKLSEGKQSVNIQCLTKPTRTLRLNAHQNSLWSTIALLRINFNSLLINHDIEQLKAFFSLFSHPSNTLLESLSHALISIDSRQTVARNPNNTAGTTSFCQGVEVILELDEERLVGQSAYLIASVLERLFSLSVTLNSFTQLTVKNRGKRKILYQWAPRLGSKALL